MTVTLYHRTGDGWTRRVLSGVWARWSHGTTHSAGVSRGDAAQSLLLIPWQQGLEIAPGDGVYDGRGPEVGDGPLKAELPQAQVVNQVSCHHPGSPLDHWEVTAR